MAFTTMDEWDVGMGVHRGEKGSNPRASTAANREFSSKSSDDL